MSAAYFNEFDPFAAAWLGNLFPDAVIDQRSIVDVKAADLAGYERCHFFGGIGGWELALHLAGWPKDRPVYTASCPCPPFSAAAKKQRCPACGGRPVPCPRRTGYFICLGCENAWSADDRHLWPEFYRLIRLRRPPVIFGEQVASKDGRIWFAGVRATLERIGYAVGAADLAAASINAPHIRQRLFWVAESRSSERQRWSESVWEQRAALYLADRSELGGMSVSDPRGRENASVKRRNGESQAGNRQADQFGSYQPPSGLEHATGDGRIEWRAEPVGVGAASGRCEGFSGCTRTATRLIQHGEYQYAGRTIGVCEQCFQWRESQRLGHTDGAGSQPGRQATSIDGHGSPSVANGRSGGMGESFQSRLEGLTRHGDDGRQPRRIDPSTPGPVAATGSINVWSNYDLIHCRDGKTRRVESGTFPLAHGIPNRVGLLRGYGNAIVPQVAATFIQAYLEVEKQ